MQNQKCLILSQTYYFQGGGESTTHNWKVIYYAKSEVLDLESNLLFLGGGGEGGNLLHETGSAWIKLTISGRRVYY